MKKVKSFIFRILSGIEMTIRHFLIREPEGEPVNFPIPGQPRIMSTYGGSEPRDFNAWAQHVHAEIQARYK